MVIRTLASTVHHEIPRIKGSRFLASAAPVDDEAEALAFVDAARASWPDATHHCWAFRLEGDRSRSSDDGEPGGTAGAPILQRITGQDLHGVVVVVTRWFGGTKLGTGGLVRAYGQAAAEALEQAGFVERPVLRAVRIDLDYRHEGVVQGVLSAYGLAPAEATYDDRIHWTVRVPIEAVDGLLADLPERTAGQVRGERLQTE